jgi:long-chain acyl-CoA synthetase
MKAPKMDLETFDCVPQIISYASRKHASKVAVSYYSDSTVVHKSYKNLNVDVVKIAAYFKEHNVDSQPVALIGDCSYEWISAFYGILWSGAVPVLIDNELPDESVYELLSTVGARFAVFDKPKQDKRVELTRLLNENGVTAIPVPEIKEILKTNPAPIECTKNSGDDTAVIVFTSGTTGKNKGVMLSHKNLCADLFLSLILACEVEHTCTVAVLPVHHMFQLTTGIQIPIYYGGGICIGKGKKYLAQTVRQFKPSTLMLVPAAIEMIRKKIWAEVRLQKREKTLSKAMNGANLLLKMKIDVRRRLFKKIHTTLGGSLRTIISGGAPIDPETVKEFKAWGINIYNGYGITECSPVVSCNTLSKQKYGSVGIAGVNPYCSVKIIDGEVCVSGDIVMKGYYNDEAATQEAIKDGWFHTGDLGCIDEDGYLFITGRKKNLIILSNGENISPEELEIYYSKIEGVKDILVYEKAVNRESILSAVIVPTDELTAECAELPGKLHSYFNEQFDGMNQGLPPNKQIHDVNVRLYDFIKSSNLKIKRIQENYTI